MSASRKAAAAIVATIALVTGSAACTPQQQQDVGTGLGYLVTIAFATLVCNLNHCPSPICMFVPCDPGVPPSPTTIPPGDPESPPAS